MKNLKIYFKIIIIFILQLIFVANIFAGNYKNLAVNSYFAEKSSKDLEREAFLALLEDSKDLFDTDTDITFEKDRFIQLPDEIPEYKKEEVCIFKRINQEHTGVYIPPKGKTIFIGDLHGDLDALEKILIQTNFEQRIKDGEDLKIVFLGDYIGRGKKSIEVLKRLLELKKKYPLKVFLLRGNHETEEMSLNDGFFDEIKEKYGNFGSKEVLDKANELFDKLSLLLITGKNKKKKSIMAVHGGLVIFKKQGREVFSKIVFFVKNILKMLSFKNHILWSDPLSDTENLRKSGIYCFPESALDQLNKEQGIHLIRAHQVMSAPKEAITWDKKLLTVFSTGGRSKDSAYEGQVHSPYYVEVDLETFDGWEKEHVIPIEFDGDKEAREKLVLLARSIFPDISEIEGWTVEKSDKDGFRRSQILRKSGRNLQIEAVSGIEALLYHGGEDGVIRTIKIDYINKEEHLIIKKYKYGEVIHSISKIISINELVSYGDNVEWYIRYYLEYLTEEQKKQWDDCKLEVIEVLDNYLKKFLWKKSEFFWLKGKIIYKWNKILKSRYSFVIRINSKEMMLKCYGKVITKIPLQYFLFNINRKNSIIELLHDYFSANNKYSFLEDELLGLWSCEEQEIAVDSSSKVCESAA
jgi:hypothetical protein